MFTHGPAIRDQHFRALRSRSHRRRRCVSHQLAPAAQVEWLEKRMLLSSTSNAPVAGAVMTEIEAVTSQAEVVSTNVNGAANANRSGISEITFSFSEAVTVSAATSLKLVNQTTGTLVSLAAATLVNNGTTSLTWDLSGVTLANGRYTAELPAAATTPAVFPTHTVEFHKLTSDTDGNGFVNFDDYFAVRDDFNAVGNNYGPGDADGNGLVNFDDYFAVRDHFNEFLDPFELDFGDAPDSAAFPTTQSTDGARHIITGNGPFLGAFIDAETDGQSSADATGDDVDAVDNDEDGIAVGDLERGTSVAVTVTANVPATAVFSGWVDFNRDGDWDDAGEQVFADVPLSDGVNNLSIDVPSSAALGETIARFRVTDTAGYAYFGLAPDGEVEDYSLTITGPPASEQIVLGPSDNIALDQPRVTVLLTEDEAGTDQVGPFIFNTFLLDTGSNGILAMASAVSEMKELPYVYQTEGEFFEQGVAGPSLFDISAPYYFYFAADGNGYVPELPLPETRILSNALNDFSIFGPYGIAGMPVMEGRVTSLDFSGWSGGLDEDLGNIFLVTTFSDSVPAGLNRFSVPLDNRLTFDPQDGILSGDHPPTYSDVPFLTAIISNDGIDKTGNLVVDTGAQIGILSSEVGLGLNLDSNGDGVLDPLDDDYVETFVIGGVGGEIEAHMFFIEEVRIPTEQGVELVWTDLGWLILDIETPEGQPSIDGVFGSDLLTSGWVNTIFMDPPGPDGYIQQAHFDFRDWSETGNGTLYLDLTTTQSASVAVGEAFLPVASSSFASRFSELGTLDVGLENNLIPGTGLSFALQNNARRPGLTNDIPAGSAATGFLAPGNIVSRQDTQSSAISAAFLSPFVERHVSQIPAAVGRDRLNIADGTVSRVTSGLFRVSAGGAPVDDMNDAFFKTRHRLTEHLPSAPGFDDDLASEDVRTFLGSGEELLTAAVTGREFVDGLLPHVRIF